MLVTLKEILNIAEQENKAVGAFNTPNLTTLKAVIAAAEYLDEPVIIMLAQVHEETLGICSIDEMGPIMCAFAARAKVPVCVHLDHGTDLEYIRRGLELGFTSVMYDGSALGMDKNIENTKKVVAMAAETGASVEAEIGSMGTSETGEENESSAYTDPAAAKEFVEETVIDALACAFGTAHGFYSKTPKLDFERLSEIKELVSVPLVMHGGSGVSPEDYREVINRGIRKINYYTYLAEAGSKAVAGKEYRQFHDLLTDVEQAMKVHTAAAIRIFSGKQ